MAVTGIRSEYDILSSVFKAITARKDLKLSLIVTGAHLSKKFGYTIDEIKKDGFNIIACIESLIDSDADVDRLKGAAIQLKGLAETVDRVRPDLILAFGDREEAITTALTGNYLNIPVVHISGGDRVIGNVDDQIRHAVTKLSHFHLTTNEESFERILKMGEQEFRVFNVGHPGLDRIASEPQMSKQELLSWYGFESNDTTSKLLVVIQHVISTEINESYSQMKKTMEAILSLKLNTVISYPNSDAGSLSLIKCIEEYRHLPFIKIHKNVPRFQFVNTLRHASCLVGNSSAGLMEAPFLKLAVVNVGNRQLGRLHAMNVEFVPPQFREFIPNEYNPGERAAIWVRPIRFTLALTKVSDPSGSSQLFVPVSTHAESNVNDVDVAYEPIVVFSTPFT